MKQRNVFTIYVFFLLLGVVVLSTGCGAYVNTLETVKGSGQIVSESRQVSGFSSIDIMLGAELVLIQAPGEALTVEADDNLMLYITTEVINGQLVVSTPPNISLQPSRPVQLYLTFETLTAVDVYGSCDITAAELNLDELAITFFGSGSTALTGRADHQTITVRGTANINNFDLASERVTVEIDGTGMIEVNAEETLDVSVAGSGNIRYTGDPAITQNIRGAATIAQSQ